MHACVEAAEGVSPWTLYMPVPGMGETDPNTLAGQTVGLKQTVWIHTYSKVYMVTYGPLSCSVRRRSWLGLVLSTLLWVLWVHLSVIYAASSVYVHTSSINCALFVCGFWEPIFSLLTVWSWVNGMASSWPVKYWNFLTEGFCRLLFNMMSLY